MRIRARYDEDINGPPIKGMANSTDLSLQSSVGVRRSIQYLPSVLRPAEQILCAATGFLEGRSGVVLATSDRLLFVYRKQTPISVRYEEILQFRARAGIVTAELEFEDSVGRAVIKQVHPRQRLVKLAAILHDPPNPRPASSSERMDGSKERNQLFVRFEDEPSVAGWRPKLRTKVSLLPTRPNATLKQAVEEPMNPEAGASTLSSGAWRPELSISSMTTPATPSAAFFQLSHAGRISVSRDGEERSSPLANQWLQPGEWALAVFRDVMTVRADGSNAEGAGTVILTNRRMIFCDTDGLRDECSDRPLEAMTDRESPKSNRIRFLDGTELDFIDATSARNFATALKAARDLASLVATTTATARG